MTTFISINKSLFLFCLLGSLLYIKPSFAQTKEDFANQLVKERDYFRAISIFKDLAFFSNDKDSIIRYKSMIGKCYQFSKKYELSINYYSNILSNYELSNDLKNKFLLNLSVNYIGLNVPAQAIFYVEESIKTDSTGFSHFIMGISKSRLGKWREASNYFEKSSVLTHNQSVQKKAQEYSTSILKGKKLPYKSPFVASLLSSVVPGAGQFYSQHFFDSFQAFAFVTAFAFGSYLAFQHEKGKSNSSYILTGLSISLTSLFHIANIVGANKTAIYRNNRTKEIFLQKFTVNVLNDEI